jgi:Putative zinc-finger
MDLRCEAVRKMLQDILDGHLSGSEQENLDRHLRDCPDCREFQRQLDSLATGIKKMPYPELTSSGSRRIWRGIMMKTGYSTKLWRGWALSASAVSILLICILSVSMVRNSDFGNSEQSGEFTRNCSSLFHENYPMDLGALLSLDDPEPGTFRLKQDKMLWLIPENLKIHGPYALHTETVLMDTGKSCLPFVSPTGHVILLHVSPSNGNLPSGSFEVRPDPRRVLYHRASWNQSGCAWTIEGRLPPDYLLDLAMEMASQMTVSTRI